MKFRLPPDHYKYLEFLVLEKKRLGSTPNDAARYILIRELDAMLKEKYHETSFE